MSTAEEMEAGRNRNRYFANLGTSRPQPTGPTALLQPTTEKGAAATGSTGAAGLNGVPGTLGPSSSAAGAGPNAGSAGYEGANGPAKPIPIKPNFANFPSALKSLPNWVLWRHLVPKSMGKKWRKVPVQPNGKTADTTDRSTWSQFDACCAAYDRGGFDGLGFVFDGEIGPDGLCYCGVDFDACVRDGNVQSLAQNRIKRLDTYTELSPSGTGFHCIARAEPLDRIVKFDGVEVYTKARYFTFTGVAFGEIKAASTEISVLVNEVRAKEAAAKQQQSCRSGPSGVSSTEVANTFKNFKPAQTFAALDPQGDNLADGIRSVPWFETLSPELKDEVVDYALGLFAKNTQLLELEANGGNNAEYYKLATSVARSGAPNAEDIFVKHASSAKDADPDEALRQYFSRCRDSQPSGDREITVGTLLRLAQQNGASFDQWKCQATPDQKNVGGQAKENDTIYYYPGNETACRTALDKIVAADQSTFTSGDMLLILRVPDPNKPGLERWSGDLPGTTQALPADIIERAENLAWMTRTGGKGEQRWNRSKPPRDFCTDYITQLRGRYGARPLVGIARVQHMRNDGSVRTEIGYDPETGIYVDRAPTLAIPESPTLDDAKAALQRVLKPFEHYTFEDRENGPLQVFAANLTALQRPYMKTAPVVCREWCAVRYWQGAAMPRNRILWH